MERLTQDEEIAKRIAEMEQEVIDGNILPAAAAAKVITNLDRTLG